MARKPRPIARNTAIGAAVATLVFGFIVGRATAPRSDGADGADGATEAKEVSPAAGAAAGSKGYVEKALDLEPSPSKGPQDAPIVIYEVSDFQ